MKVDISIETYEAIRAISPDVSSFIERAAQRALAEPSKQESGGDLKGRFAEFRGAITGVSVEELVESRHAGLP